MIRFSRFLLLIGFCISSMMTHADDNSLLIAPAQQCSLERIASEPKLTLEECLIFVSSAMLIARNLFLASTGIKATMLHRDFQGSTEMV